MIYADARAAILLLRLPRLLRHLMIFLLILPGCLITIRAAHNEYTLLPRHVVNTTYKSSWKAGSRAAQQQCRCAAARDAMI